MLVDKYLNRICRKFNCWRLFAMFYAVRSGRKPGVYTSWSECQEQIKAFPKARFKKCPSEKEAWLFVNGTAPEIYESSTYEASKSSLSEPPQHASMSASDNSAFCDCLNTVKLTAESIKHQIEAVASTYETLCLQIERLEKLASSFNGTLSGSHSVGQFSDTDGGTVRSTKYVAGGSPVGNLGHFNEGINKKLYPQKRLFSGGPKDDLKLKKQRSNGDEENCTGSPFDESVGSVVYTDGACVGNGKSRAMAGIGVYWGPGNINNVSERLTGRQTNNRAEIHAARKAIEQAKGMGIKNLILYTDSMFLINGITKWIKGWKRNGWILSTGKPVINREDFEKLEEAMNKMNIKWVYVRGHRGDTGNEAADSLATSGARKSLPGE